jgi:hypothetical protein
LLVEKMLSHRPHSQYEIDYPADLADLADLTDLADRPT